MHKILIVEDEPDTAKVVAKRLIKQGYKVVLAADSYQAIQYMHKENPDLIILDLILPGGGGLFALENIRLSSPGRVTPVVVLTSMKNEEYKKKILSQGVEAYLEKPYEPATLITTIQNILNKT